MVTKNTQELSSTTQAPIAQITPLQIEAWDPLARVDEDPAVYAAAQKREIKNILKSYTGYFDLFAEMIQNALDAVEKRKEDEEEGYYPQISIHINIQQGEVTVVDNGCAMVLAQFRQFLKPSLSFKDGGLTRGNKGVGATYLAFGFNHLEVATKPGTAEVYAGVLRRGREWLDDTKASVPQPTVEPIPSFESELAKID